MIVMANWLMSMFLVVGKCLQIVLFGELRLIEIEHIYEYSKFTILNSLIVLSMLSADYMLVPGILTMFLVFMKIFHWILKDRLEFILQHATTPSDVLATRNTLTYFLLLFVDFNLVYSCIEYSFTNNPDVYLLFGIEFAVLFIDLLLEGSKLMLNVWEIVYLQRHPDDDIMEDKSMYIKVCEIVHSFLILLIYSFLFFTLMKPYKVPVYLLKDILFNAVSLFKQITSLIKFLKAAKELDIKLKDATEDDLSDDNNLCSICRDDMTTIGVRKGERMYPKKLNCGHIIHMGCLKSWCERSQVCPMCRAPVFGAPAATARSDTVPVVPPAQGAQQQQREQQPNEILEEIPYFRPPVLEQIRQGPIPTGNTLHLRPNALVPPDWKLLRLANPNNSNNEFQVQLNSNITGQVAQLKKAANENTTTHSNTNKTIDLSELNSLKEEMLKLRQELNDIKSSKKYEKSNDE